jgi:hypothetical protein
MDRDTGAQTAMKKHPILFLAANPSETDRLALVAGEVAPVELRDVVGDAARPDAMPCHGLYFHGTDCRARVVSAGALRDVFAAVGSSVKLVILNACYSEPAADALLMNVDCVVGMAGSIGDQAARSFAVGFYGGLGERASIEAAYRGGCAAIGLEGHPDGTLPRLKVRSGVNPGQLILAALTPAEPAGGTAAQPQVPVVPTPSGVSGSGDPPRKVFVSHSSRDKPGVKELVDALRARGIDAWLTNTKSVQATTSSPSSTRDSPAAMSAW